jgi:hypothetical protein
VNYMTLTYSCRNFGIFKHPGTNNAGSSQPAASEEAPSPLLRPEINGDKHRRPSSAKNDTSTAQEQLVAKGFLPVQWYGKCEADKVSTGTYPVTKGHGGMYGA